MDHRPEAMAKLPAVPTRQPPRSVRNATVVSERDELIALLLQQTQRMEQLEGRLILLLRNRVQPAGVRDAGVRTAFVQPMIPRPTSYLAAANSHLSRTEVWSQPHSKDKLRAPAYTAALRKSLEMERSNQGITKVYHLK